MTYRPGTHATDEAARSTKPACHLAAPAGSPAGERTVGPLGRQS